MADSDMSLTTDLLEKFANLPIAAKNTVLNGLVYLGADILLVVWPDATQVARWAVRRYRW